MELNPIVGKVKPICEQEALVSLVEICYQYSLNVPPFLLKFIARSVAQTGVPDKIRITRCSPEDHIGQCLDG